MQHLIREDPRGMLSVPEALWLQAQAAPPRTPLRARLAAALLALARRLAPAAAPAPAAPEHLAGAR